MSKYIKVWSAIVAIYGFIITMMVGYISNIIFIFKLESFTATGETILATIGVFLPPLGIIHGIYTWF